MLSNNSLLFLFLTIIPGSVLSLQSKRQASHACAQIEFSITGDVYFPLSLSLNFFEDSEDYYMSSSAQEPVCVVEVANIQDISNVIEIISATRSPFAVKSGGHASNQGFSSTPGVLISLVRLNQVVLSADKSTAEVGLGNRWTDVYTALNGTGVNIIGGRVPGPGVGGFSLGGGYSWLTDQYGLTCDNIEAYNLVLPNGTITIVNSSQPDLFFALKGGLNRFGIVSSIIFKTVLQPNLIYGGSQIFPITAVPALISATETFQTSTSDPKAQVILTINGGLVSEAILLSFYDGPNRPAVFDPYNGIGPLLISTLASQSFSSFVSGIPAVLEQGHRGAFHTMMTTSLTAGFMTAVLNETTFYSGLITLAGSGLFISYDIEPFSRYGQYATNSSFPHSKSPLPLNLFYSWSLEEDDDFWRGTMQTSVDHLTEVARAEGIFSDSPAYPNYALDTYHGAQLYGEVNAAKLQTIRAEVDPQGVMGLTGGFSFE